MNALRAAKAGHASQAGASGAQSGAQSGASRTKVKVTQLKQCMPGIMKTCQPQVIELMTNPLYADGSALVTCAKQHSSTIGGPCEKIVEKLTNDGLAEKMIKCGQDFLGVCPAESMALMATEMSNQVVWAKVHGLVICLAKKKNQISQTCDVLADALAKQEEEQDPNWGKYKKQHSNAAATESENQFNPMDEEDEEGGGAGAIVVALLGICTCGLAT